MKHQTRLSVRQPRFSLSKNLFFDRLAAVKGAIKTSNTPSKCMWILEGGVLRSKAKYLAAQGIFRNLSVKKDYLPFFYGTETFLLRCSIFCILPVGGFFDTLKRGCLFDSLVLHAYSLGAFLAALRFLAERRMISTVTTITAPMGTR